MLMDSPADTASVLAASARAALIEKAKARQEARRPWRLYQLFLMQHLDHDPVQAEHAAEWLQGQYHTIDALLDSGPWHGCAFAAPLSKKTKAAWRAFQDEHEGMDAETVELLLEIAELDWDEREIAQC